MNPAWVWMDGVIVRGHGFASGIRGCQDVGGSIRAQRASFEAGGVDMSRYYNGTINVDISPFSYAPKQSFKTVRGIKWHSEWPAEDFSFFRALFEAGGKQYEGLVYYPHPDTKPSTFLGHSMLELLLPHIDKIQYDQKVRAAIDSQELEITRKS